MIILSYLGNDEKSYSVTMQMLSKCFQSGADEATNTEAVTVEYPTIFRISGGTM